MRPSSTARRYAEAAFDVARQQGDVPGWLAELNEAAKGLSHETTTLYFRDPNVPQEQKLATLEAAFAGVRPEILNLIRMLQLKGRLPLIPTILAEMRDLDRRARGIVEVTVTVARPIADAEKQEIGKRLGDTLRKNVDIHTQVDPAILGGVVIRIGDQLIDASVAGRLERLRHELAV
jgi:F-type H+-transporting ATPase subunit delta